MASGWDTIADVDLRAGGERFHDVSGWGRDWTVGPLFSIELGPLPTRARRVLRLTAAPFGTQRLALSCNGVAIGRHVADAPFVASFPLAAEVAEDGGALRFEIALADARRPSEVGPSADDRLLGLAIARIEILGTDASGREAWPSRVREPDDAAHDRDVLAAFESLGDNCELGFVQKRLGVTGSALLRFCATPVERLIDGLAHGFSGIGDPDAIEVLEEGPPGAVEYQIRLRRYGLHYHTLVFTHEAARGDVLRGEREKLGHKHAKFVAGLAAGDRIYVLKRNDGLAAATIWTVWLLLQRFGANALLVVRAAEDGEDGGIVRVLAPGLLEATIGGFAAYTDATRGDDAAWIALCRAVLRQVGAERAPGTGRGAPGARLRRPASAA